MRHQRKTFEEINAFFAGNSRDLTGRGLWAHGSEIGACDPGLWDSAPLKILVARLSTYRDVAQSISHGLVAQLFRAAGAFVDFAYLPPPRDAENFRESGIPFLFGTTTKRPAADFDIVAFSCSYILEILNIPLMLAESGIPLEKSERIERDDVPLIILGGASAFAAHIVDSPPGGGGALVDIRFPGDGEVTVPLIAEIAQKHRGNKMAALEEMQKRIPGARVTDVTGNCPAERAVSYDFDNAPALTEPLVPFEESAMRGVKLEISRGCAHGCSFCEEGYKYLPYRERSPSMLGEALTASKRGAAVEAVDLASFNFTDHRDLAGVLRTLLPLVKRITVKSARLDAIAANPALAPALAALGKRDATGGVEGISGRLRAFCNKRLTDDEIVAACTAFFEAGMREIKLFFIFTGRENDDDIEEYGSLFSRITGSRDRIRRRSKIVCSFTPLTVMPNTPLQWLAVKPVDTASGRRIAKIKSVTRRNRCTFRLATTAEEYRLGQFLVLAGGQSLPKIVDAVLESGEPYYRKVQKRLYETLKPFLSDNGELGRMLRAEKKPDHAFPWDESPPGVREKFLRERYENASAFRNSEPCILAEPGGECLDCGACPEPPAPAAAKPFSLTPSDIERLKGVDREAETIRVAVRIEPRFRFIPKEYAGIAVATAILTDDESAKSYRGAADSLWRHLPISRNGDPAAGLHIYEFEFNAPAGIKSVTSPREFRYGAIEGVIVPTVKLQTDRLHYRVSLGDGKDAKRFEHALRQILEKKKVGFSLPEDNGVKQLVLKKKPLKSKFIAAVISERSADFIVKREFGFTDFVFTALGQAAHAALWSLEKVYFIPSYGEACESCGRTVEYDSATEQPAGESCLSCRPPI